ncbi:hypothetical protein C3L33_16173, partial [Rhododendron williamsianum]
MSSLESQTANFDEEDSHRKYAMQLASASVLPMVLKSAIELGVLEIIAKAGPGALLSPSEIATSLQTINPEAPLVLDRILRLLASYSILTCSLSTHCTNGQQEVNSSSSSRLYGLAPVSKYFIPNQDGLSFAPMLHVIQDKVTVNMWYHLKDAVMEGGLPFNRAYGMNAFDYVGNDARCRDLFKSFMGDYNPMFMKQILETYRGFEGLNSIVDVGGGDGAILNMIVSKYPTIKGINFDLAPVIEKSPSYPGIENVVGDMFMSIPRGDAIFMKWILHSWDDEHCLNILKNCYKSLPDNGKVIVVDMVVPETPETGVAVKSDFQLTCS